VPRTFNQDFMKTDTVHARFARSQSARRTNLPLPRKHGKLVDHRTENPTAPLVSDMKAFFRRESFIAWTEWTTRQERCCLNPFPRHHKIATSFGTFRRDNHRFASDPVFANFGHLVQLGIDFSSKTRLSGGGAWRGHGYRLTRATAFRPRRPRVCISHRIALLLRNSHDHGS
jgi:hypothetical protein